MPVFKKIGKLWNIKNEPKNKSGFLIRARLNSSFKINPEFKFAVKKAYMS